MAPRTRESVRRDMTKIAVLEIEGLMDASHRRFPREVAMALGDGSTVLAWLVSPEATWATTKSVECVRLGDGLPPSMVIQEMCDAAQHVRVYSSYQFAAVTWLAALFASVGNPKPFRINDLDDLNVPSRKTADRITEENWNWATDMARRRAPSIERAASKAARHLEFVSELASVVG